MQFILELLWDLSCSKYLAVLPEKQTRNIIVIPFKPILVCTPRIIAASTRSQRWPTGGLTT